MPSEFARQPRSLMEMDRWKATEFRQCILYTGPLMLKGVVTEEVHNHFLRLSVTPAILLISKNERRNARIHYANKPTNLLYEKM